MDNRLRALFGFLKYDSEERISEAKRESLFYDALGYIEQDERRIVEMAYGRLQNGEKYSDSEIAEEIGWDVENVRLTRHSALHKMMDHLMDLMDE